MVFKESNTEGFSMDPIAATSTVGSTLVKALSQVSADAAPGLVDAVLLTTQCSPSFLLLGVLRQFPFVYEDHPSHASGRGSVSATEAGGDLYTYLVTIAHVLRNKASTEEDLLKAIWTVYVPLLRNRSPASPFVQVQVAEMLADTIAVKFEWDAIKHTLLPLCLSSLYPTCQLKDDISLAANLERRGYSWWQKQEKEYKIVAIHSATGFQEELFSPSAVSHLLSTLMSIALQTFSANSDAFDGRGMEKVHSTREFCEDMVSLFLAPALAQLLQPQDETIRLCSMQTLLPPLLKSASMFGWRDDLSPEKRILNAKTSPMQEVWHCCKVLLSRGPSERRDAYMTLALFSDVLLHPESKLDHAPSTKTMSGADVDKVFDVRSLAEFWETLKMGLGDGDSLTRKRALHVLKKALAGVTSSAPGLATPRENGSTSLKRETTGKTGIKVSNRSVPKKRDRWADEEASSSLRDTTRSDATIPVPGLPCRWDAFLLLHETLEEYGIHLVEAAWNHQMSSILQFTESKGESKDSGPYWVGAWSPKGSLCVDINFAWIAILWQRGFDNKNPQVRRLVMKSFLEIEWGRIRKLSHLVPEDYILGSLMRALDDPVQHRDFGMKGIYSSAVADGAAKFMCAYSPSLSSRRRLGFVVRLTRGLLSQSLSRPGLMTLTMCLEAAAVAVSPESVKTLLSGGMSNDCPLEDDTRTILDLLRGVVENSKRQFNPKYREKVCSHVLKAASALNIIPVVPFSKFAFFLSSFSKELLTHDGPLHNQLTSWINSSDTSTLTPHTDVSQWLVEGVQSVIEQFLEPYELVSSPVTDEDVQIWRVEAERYARLLILGLVEGRTILSVLSWIQMYAQRTYNHAYKPISTRLKLSILIQSLLKESSPPEPSFRRPVSDDGRTRMVNGKTSAENLAVVAAGVSNLVVAILGGVADYARRSADIFREYEYNGVSALPASVSGKLGGPSQRRLPAVLTSAILEAVISVSTVASCCLWCCSEWPNLDIPESLVTFLWSYAWTVVTSPAVTNECDAEVRLASYEALTFVCSALAATANPFLVTAAHASVSSLEGEPFPLPLKGEKMVDGLTKALLKNVGDARLIDTLARSRRGVLTAHKWCCLDSLLSISKKAVASPEDDNASSISSSVLEGLLHDCIDSLECAGEEYVLPLLRCVRWLTQWGVLEQLNTDDDPENKYQVMWMLVQSGWSAMADVNKRRVGPTAAFLSAMFHPATFSDLDMHGTLRDETEHGPLKWLLNRLIDLGFRSPRTMRLTALHVTGLWLLFPETAIFYVAELKKLALYGGDSVDEELDGDLMESQISAREYATLIESSDPELTEEFTNSEMYVRVVVAVMVDKLAKFSGNIRTCKIGSASVTEFQARNFGQKFLFDLLHAAVTDADLSKELYKKKSAVHRRKVRLWQMLCILSQFVNTENISEVMRLLKVCLHNNNLSSVRQYIEIFAIHMYLAFPHLVEVTLIPALRDYNTRPQALASYVLISANVLMFTPAPKQRTLLHRILPAILPLMTSHHHSLRSFTQVLIYKIIQKFSASEGLFDSHQAAFPQGECLRSIVDYLEGNLDCAKMRNAVEKHLDAYDPTSMTRPRGIFCIESGEADPARTAEDHPFECVPVALLDQVGIFLSEAREELRESMAESALTISAERFKSHNEVDRSDSRPTDLDTAHEGQSRVGLSCEVTSSSRERSVRNSASTRSDDVLFHSNSNIQKKMSSMRLTDNVAAYDTENELLLSSIESRAKELIRLRGGRQDLVVVASLLGRIPNLAGLARTCEVFKASKLVVADATIAEDRQFQMISVTADQWIPLVEVPEAALGTYLTHKRKEGYSILGLEQTAQSVSIDKYLFPAKVVLVLGREGDGIPVDIIQALDLCLEIPQLGVIRSLNVHVSGAIAIWEYTRQHLAYASQPIFKNPKKSNLES